MSVKQVKTYRIEFDYKFPPPVDETAELGRPRPRRVNNQYATAGIPTPVMDYPSGEVLVIADSVEEAIKTVKELDADTLMPKGASSMSIRSVNPTHQYIYMRETSYATRAGVHGRPD